MTEGWKEGWTEQMDGEQKTKPFDEFSMAKVHYAAVKWRFCQLMVEKYHFDPFLGHKL